MNLQKVYKAQMWSEVFKGHGELNPMIQEEVKKQLLLERFGEEHPGFDFSGAKVNGQVPDARTYMGGLSYT